MVDSNTLKELLDSHSLAQQSVVNLKNKRFVYPELKAMLRQRAFVGLAGVRGVGKTVLLRQLASELKNSMYLSADSLPAGADLFGIIKDLSSGFGKKWFLIDEIHGVQAWQQSLKKIYDFLPVKVVFTSSASVDIIQSKYDLSRRVVILPVKPFTFREYLFFKHGIRAKRLILERVLHDYKKLYPLYAPYEHYYDEFCRLAIPSMLDSPLPQTIDNILEKIINNDLMKYGRLDASDLLNARNAISFIANSPIDGCSYSSISRNLGVNKYKAISYVNLLEKAFVLRVILPEGPNVLKEPKILFALPFRYYLSKARGDPKLVGALREEFFIHHVAGSVAELYYAKNLRGEKIPDYIIRVGRKKYVFEIGGARKGFGQLKLVNPAEFEGRLLVTMPGQPEKGIPLILFGFL
ncbi:hypothetical protein COS70_04910 [Candidatus Micrarchaeota archaeon CG06_land_8_20_14_3_00_50_6]|nr:MAG: hypothetical protein COS70_04910 [Candidatus Micrarchaeota archaeon CG06_land_8_20_14_3_00_50_6]